MSFNISDKLGLDVNKFTQRNPANAELDEKSKKLEGLTQDNIQKIRSPRNQARQIDRTIDNVSNDVCNTVASKVQALINGDITPKEFLKAMGDIGPNAMDSLLKDGLGIKDIKDLGKKVGVSLNPETKVSIIKDHLEQIDLVLIMSVNPGFGGQKFMPEVLDKIKELKNIQKEQNIDFDIEIDGGINFENSKIAIKAGANILVSGTTIFKSNNGDIKKNIDLLKLR